YFKGSSTEINGSLIEGNHASSDNESIAYNGGGIYSLNSTINITNTQILNNNTGGSINENGGGIFIDIDETSSREQQGTNYFTNLEIRGNKSEFGSGIYIQDASAVIRNCVISGNVSEQKGAIYNVHSDVKVINTTIAGNTAQSANAAGGIFCRNVVEEMYVINSIIYFNSTPEFDFDQGPNYLTVLNSAFPDETDSYNNNAEVNLTLIDNTFEDPEFEEEDVISGNGLQVTDYNLNLSGDSPCINTGIASYILEDVDIIGLTEDDYVGPFPDMGAYESLYEDLAGCMDDTACNYNEFATA
ncbi:uncharacterized protein METZ01_LOCUS376096, partial [marine metagenome]